MGLYFKQIGNSGQPLIILHGLFGSLDNWLTVGKYWAKKYKVFLVDQRNHGKSFHSSEHSYPLMAEDLHEFASKNKLSNILVLGHSMGGKTAMEFAMRYPDLIEKLIVVDIAPVSYQVHHYQIINGLKSIDLTRISSRKEADEKLSESIKELGIRQFLLKNLFWKEKEVLSWRFNLAVLAENILPISEYDILGKTFSKQTLFIKGGKSAYIAEEYYPLIYAKFPKAKIEEIREAGHWVHAEQRDKFVQCINQFLTA